MEQHQLNAEIQEGGWPRPDLLRLAIFACSLCAAFLPILQATMLGQQSPIHIGGWLVFYPIVPVLAGLAVIAPWSARLARHQAAFDKLAASFALLAILVIGYLGISVAITTLFGTIVTLPFAAIGSAPMGGDGSGLEAGSGIEEFGASLGAGGCFLILALIIAAIRPLRAPQANATR